MLMAHQIMPVEGCARDSRFPLMSTEFPYRAQVFLRRPLNGLHVEYKVAHCVGAIVAQSQSGFVMG